MMKLKKIPREFDDREQNLDGTVVCVQKKSIIIILKYYIINCLYSRLQLQFQVLQL